MTKLTALIDGSIYSQSVCDHAAWYAGRAGMAVDIVHVLGRRDVPSEPANLSGSIGLGARTALLEELAELDAQKARLGLKRGRALLAEAQDRVAAAGIDRIETRLRREDIVETVQQAETESELIVIGKRGEAADFAKLHLGSNLERVVRSVHKPVLVSSRAFKPIERVLIAFDGGTSAMKAVDHIARSHAFAGLSCRLVSVGEISASVAKRLDDAAMLLRGAGYAIEGERVEGQPHKVISGLADSGVVDMVVMGAYSHSRIRTLFIGSTTSELIRGCKIPVMLFR